MYKLIKFSIVFLFLLQAGSRIAAQSFSFGMLTDVHYAAIPDKGTRKFSQSLDKMAQCIDTMNKKKVGFLIELGDFKDMTVPPDKNATLGYLKTAETAFTRFKGDRYHVLGNHDEDCISKKEFYSVVENSGIEGDHTWYSFNKGGYRFIVLDACFDSTGRSYDSGNFDWSDANLPSVELKWLENELNNNRQPVIVFVHQLLYGNSKATIKNAGTVRAVLEKSRRVKCVFQGHEHSGGYEMINGIHYYTLKGMIEGDLPGSNSFAIVNIKKDTILIHGFGNAVTQSLPLN